MTTKNEGANNQAPMSDYRKQLAENIIDAIRDNKAPWQRKWSVGELSASYNGKTGIAYRGINSLNLATQEMNLGYGRNDWYTYNQANDLGAQVRKGEKGTRIEVWRFTDTRDEIGSDGKPVVGENGKKNKIEVKLDSPRVMYYTVFNGSQIDNLPEIKREPKREVDAIQRGEDLLNTLVQGMGVGYSHGGNKAYYSRRDDRVQMPERNDFVDAASYYSTALHELAHATGHEDRLDREFGKVFGNPAYAREELRAEIASWMISAETGLPHDPDNHAAYLSSWLTALEKEPNEIFKAVKDAERIVGFMKEIQIEHEKTNALGEDKTSAKNLDSVQKVNAIRTDKDTALTQTQVDVDGVVYNIKPVQDHSAEKHSQRWPSAKDLTGERDVALAREVLKDSLVWEAVRKDINWTVDNAKIISPVLANVSMEHGELTGKVAAETQMAVYLQIASKTVVQLDKTRLFNLNGIEGVAHTGDFMKISFDRLDAGSGRMDVQDISQNEERKITQEESFQNAKTAAQIELSSQDIAIERVDNEVGSGVHGTYLLETTSHIVVHKPGSSEITIAAKNDLVRNKDQPTPQLGQVLHFDKTENGKVRVSARAKEKEITNAIER